MQYIHDNNAIIDLASFVCEDKQGFQQTKCSSKLLVVNFPVLQLLFLEK
jgi:hypothetical protein